MMREYFRKTRERSWKICSLFRHWTIVHDRNFENKMIEWLDEKNHILLFSTECYFRSSSITSKIVIPDIFISPSPFLSRFDQDHCQNFPSNKHEQMCKDTNQSFTLSFFNFNPMYEWSRQRNTFITLFWGICREVFRLQGIFPLNHPSLHWRFNVFMNPLRISNSFFFSRSYHSQFGHPFCRNLHCPLRMCSMKLFPNINLMRICRENLHWN